MRAVSLLLATLLLASPLAALAADAADPATEIAEKRARIEKLREERDAARVKANTYVLPKYKLEAQEKQEQIDALEAEIEALEKKQP